MSKSAVGPHYSWLESLHKRAKVEMAVSKQLADIPRNPFKGRDVVTKAKEALEREGSEIPEGLSALLVDLESKCVVAEAEFWDRFEHECAQRNWSLEGTTSRRILCRGVSLELRAGAVAVEELGLSFRPFADDVVQQLELIVAELVPQDFDPRAFMDLLAASYDQTGGPSEKSIEAVYRSAVLLSQKPLFWKSLAIARFTRLTRPAFRARMAAVLEANTSSRDGRVIRFGTSVNTSQAWEIYSPGERRSVQVGRIAFLRGGDSNDD